MHNVFDDYILYWLMLTAPNDKMLLLIVVPTGELLYSC